MTMTTTTKDAPSTEDLPSTGCCPRFDPEPWRGRELVWRDKLFLKERVHCAWHVPLNLRRALKRAYARIQAAGASPKSPLLLSDDTSPWHSDLYLELTTDVPGATVVRLSGTYLTEVFEGPYRDAPRWMRDTRDRAAAQGKTVEKMYLGYTTCPKCAKAYGENYVLVFAKIA